MARGIGRDAAENTVLRVIADEAGLPETAGGCFVSGGSAGNLSHSRSPARRPSDSATPRGQRLRVVVGTDAHSSIVNTLRLLEMDALVVETPDHRLTAEAVNAALEEDQDVSDVAAVVCTSGTTNAGIIDDLAGVGEIAKQRGWWFHVDGAYGGSGIFAPSVRDKYTGIEQADSFILDPHKWLFTPFDCCALIYRQPELATATHTQDASYLDVIHVTEGEWNPTDYAYHLTRRARGTATVVLDGGLRSGRLPRSDRGCYPARPRRGDIDQVDSPPGADPRAGSRCGAVPSDRLGAVRLRQVGASVARRGGRLHSPTKWEGETVGRFAFLHPHTTMDSSRKSSTEPHNACLSPDESAIASCPSTSGL